VSFAAITLCVASQRVFIVVSVCFVIDSVRKLLDTPLYLESVFTIFFVLKHVVRCNKGISGFYQTPVYLTVFKTLTIGLLFELISLHNLGRFLR
jgi:hypothetical protein